MSADSGQDVPIFTEALKHPVAERGAFLDRACAGDAELRRKVEALLRAYERLGFSHIGGDWRQAPLWPGFGRWFVR
jgi:hypothetical protein